jgi:hypothetical protein
MSIVSDTNTQWSADNVNYANAVACWVHPSWPQIPGATWIWRTQNTNPEEEYTAVPDGGWYFKREFSLPADAYNISGTLKITADNAYAVSLNGSSVGSDGPVDKIGPDALQWSTVEEYTLSGLKPGNNVLLIRAINFIPNPAEPTNYGTFDSNPAGLIFRLDVTYDVPLHVCIDIKPGSCPNSINANERGAIPVAILGSDTFDVSQIDVASVALEGLKIKVVGKANKLLAHFEDVNGDGYMDLVVQIADTDSSVLTGSTTATLTGKLLDGTPFKGTDSINIVPAA